MSLSDDDEAFNSILDSIFLEDEDKPSKSSLSFAAMEEANRKLDEQLQELNSITFTDSHEKGSWVSTEEVEASSKALARERLEWQARLDEQTSNYTRHVQLLKEAMQAQKDIISRQAVQLEAVNRGIKLTNKYHVVKLTNVP